MDIDTNYSTETYKHLLYAIEDIEEKKMTPINIEKAVENIRHLSEYMVYGQNKNNTYFEMFAERNILQVFDNLLDRGVEEI